MDNGWIKLHRKLLESEIFASQIGLKIWIWCLIKASHKKRFTPIKIGKGESTVTVEKGSFIFGRHSAEKELNINGSTIYRWINKLQEMGMIKINSNSHYSVITMCNYEDYQKMEEQQVTAIEQPLDSHVTTIEQPLDSHVTTTQQQRNTYKNVKNVKNEKKNTKDASSKLELEKKSANENVFKKPTLEEVSAYCKERTNEVDPEGWINFYTSNGWKVGKNPMKDWKASVRTWERNGINTNTHGHKGETNSTAAGKFGKVSRNTSGSGFSSTL